MSRAIVLEALWRVTWWGLRRGGSRAAAPLPERPRRLAVPALLVVALVVVPIVEIYVLLQVGQLLGVLPTVVLLVVMSLLGAWLLRREGARTWRAFRDGAGAAAGCRPRRSPTARWSSSAARCCSRRASPPTRSGCCASCRRPARCCAGCSPAWSRAG